MMAQRPGRRSSKVVKIVCGIIADRLGGSGTRSIKRRSIKRRSIKRRSIKREGGAGTLGGSREARGGGVGNYLTHNLNFARFKNRI